MATTSAGSSSSLTALIDRAFAQASASASSTSPVESLLTLIHEAQSLVHSLSLYSSNDSIEDLPTSSLRAILLESLQALSLFRKQTRPGDFPARKDVLRQSLTSYKKYLSSLVSLRILDPASPTSYQSLLAKQSKIALGKDASPLPQDAANRRATKIAALKLERALKTSLDDYREAARAKAKSASGIVTSASLGWSSNANDGGASTSAAALINDVPETEYDVLVLPKKQGDEDDDDDDLDADEAFVGGSQAKEMDVRTPTSLRSYMLMLCHLHALLAINALDSTYTELELLNSMPSNAESLSRERAGREKDEADRRNNQEPTEEWRLDQRWGASNNTPLLDGKGKPQRPFTILPSGSAATDGQASMGSSGVQNQMDARQQLRKQVFQTSHRLPTMSIDEYLEEEQRRGNIISGGGQASADAPTSSEVLALRSQGYQVGTREAEEADEEQRRKAVDWDEFEENNPKGMGNTMNRG